jgi:alpha-L-fucosidase 2
MKYTRRTLLKNATVALAAGTLREAAGAAARSDRPEGKERASMQDAHADPDLVLWYREPAKEWLEALPIGNGRLGAMVFGGTSQEKLQLNEGTLWGGGPHDYTPPDGLDALPEIRRLVFAGEWAKAQDLVNQRFMGVPAGQMPYQTVGNLTLDFPESDVSDYRRELDLDSATVRVSYAADGIRHSRQIFSSAADQVIVVRLTADAPGKVSFAAAFDSPQKSSVETTGDNVLLLLGTSGDRGGVPGKVRFQARAQAIREGGTAKAEGGKLTVSDADAVTLLISVATSYVNYQDVSADPAERAESPLSRAARKPYAELRRDHLKDYQPRFRRVSLSLASSDASRDAERANRPTDERIASFHEGGDPRLAGLHFQFGRYLLLSCSRPGGQPATLQGLWNDHMDPPWGSKYTININTEMNYWPAASANMLECYEPLFRMISELAVAGRRTAKAQYGANGWIAHHNTDAWRGTSPVDYAFSGMWQTGGAWLCKSLWDHYEFTLDRAALKRHYPWMKGAAEFFLETLVQEPKHGWLVTCPSNSPENAHHPGVSICAGPTMDNQILRDLFGAVLHASEILGIDAEFREKVVAARDKLPPMQIGKLGQLQEWLEDWDADAPEIHHRHVSHLYGLFPSNQITPRQTPDLFAAARKSLEMRGDMATGWSLGWKINLWARLLDGDRAHKLLSDLLTPERTAPNLFDLHPPFQIDGNFGAVSGVAEMLLQSHAGEIHLLPALPSAWPDGSASGLRARGGFVVDLAWKDGKLSRATVQAGVTGPCALRLGERTVKLDAHAGKRYELDGDLRVLS